MTEVRRHWPQLTKNAQAYIACFETLAQLALAMTAVARMRTKHFRFTLPAASDNTSAESGINRLFTTTEPLSHFLQIVAAWSAHANVRLALTHLAGEKNVWADELLVATAPQDSSIESMNGSASPFPVSHARKGPSPCTLSKLPGPMSSSKHSTHRDALAQGKRALSSTPSQLAPSALQLFACRYPCSSDAEGAQVSRHTELHGNLKLGSQVLLRTRTFPVQLLPKKDVRAVSV